MKDLPARKRKEPGLSERSVRKGKKHPMEKRAV